MLLSIGNTETLMTQNKAVAVAETNNKMDSDWHYQPREKFVTPAGSMFVIYVYDERGHFVGTL